MQIRKANLDDLKTIENIYANAVKYMRENNNPDQWEEGYPGTILIKEDIDAGKCYLCVEDNKILGVFYFTTREEEASYQKIFQGSWLNEEPYGTIHRIATVKHKSGVAGFCVDYCYDRIKNIKIDTHKDNLPMRRFLIKKDFVECGVIYLADGSERIAYQKCE